MWFAGSPADQNGLQRNDVIISVDGELTQDLHHSEVVALMKHAGSKGNIVLGIRRKGDSICHAVCCLCWLGKTLGSIAPSVGSRHSHGEQDCSKLCVVRR